MIQSSQETAAAHLPYPDIRFVRTNLDWFLQESTDDTVLLAPPMTLNLPEAHTVQLGRHIANRTAYYTIICSNTEAVDSPTDYYFIDSRANRIKLQRQYNVGHEGALDEWCTPQNGDLAFISEIFDQLKAQKQPFDVWERELQQRQPVTGFMSFCIGNIAMYNQYWGLVTRNWIDYIQAQQSELRKVTV